MLPSKSPTSQSPFLLGSGTSSHRPANERAGAGDGADVDDSIQNASGAPLSTGSAAGGSGANSNSSSSASAAAKVERYRPRIFGFPVHESSKLQRWQEKVRDRQIERLERAEAEGVITPLPSTATVTEVTSVPLQQPPAAAEAQAEEAAAKA